jgi:RNA polymerase sigma-70 factor (ECF subfamily)
MRMVKLRLDRRLQGRIDPSDVLQEACIDVVRRGQDYLANPAMPVFLWLRWITGQRLVTLHRRHFGSKARNVGLEVSLHHGALPQASSVLLAAMLLGRPRPRPCWPGRWASCPTMSSPVPRRSAGP